MLHSSASYKFDRKYKYMKSFNFNPTYTINNSD